MTLDLNLFEQLQNKRSKMKQFAEAAYNKKWITTEEYENILEKIDTDILTIAVIGQMKSGKSTFLNALLFGKETLPAATTPMTAALSVITYGEKECIEVEFYNADEWTEMEMMAKRDIADAAGDKSLESKISAAKDLTSKAAALGGGLRDYLGKTTEDSLANLIEYVGADGKFVAITKSVTIYHPTEWLKNVRVVDTPGFNDPVVSREERTQEFLKFADVVVLLVYAGRAFDATDKEIIFERVRSVGVGKVLIAINKYDINYAEGETVEEMVATVQSEIEKAIEESGSAHMKGLLGNLVPVPMSANMALLAKMPLEAVHADQNKMYHWNRITDNFEISTQQQLYEKSLISNLEAAIVSTVEKEKLSILVKKPVSQINHKGASRLSAIEKDLSLSNDLVKTLSLPDNALQNKILSLGKAQRRIEGKIEDALIKLDEEFDKAIKKIKREVEDKVTETNKAINTYIDTKSIFKEGAAERYIEGMLKSLISNLNRTIEDNEGKLSKLLLNQSEDLLNEIDDILRKFVEDPDDLVGAFKRSIRKIKKLEIEEDEVVEITDGEDESFWSLAGQFAIKAASIIWAFGIFDVVSWKEDTRNLVKDYFSELASEISDVISHFQDNKGHFIQSFNGESTKHILKDIIDLSNEALLNKDKKEEELLAAKNKKTALEEAKSKLKQEVAEMHNLQIDLGLK